VVKEFANFRAINDLTLLENSSSQAKTLAVISMSLETEKTKVAQIGGAGDDNDQPGSPVLSAKPSLARLGVSDTMLVVFAKPE
jgi:hypothetical protein